MSNRIGDKFRESMGRPDPQPVKEFIKYGRSKAFCVMIGADAPDKPTKNVILSMDVEDVEGPVVFIIEDPKQLRGIIADMEDALSRLEANR